jgi:hypothetical protein
MPNTASILGSGRKDDLFLGVDSLSRTRPRIRIRMLFGMWQTGEVCDSVCYSTDENGLMADDRGDGTRSNERGTGFATR